MGYSPGVITRSKYVGDDRVNVNRYKVRSRIDRNKNEGDLIELVKQSFICKNIREYKTKYNHSDLEFQNKSRSRCSGIYSSSAENMKTF